MTNPETFDDGLTRVAPKVLKKLMKEEIQRIFRKYSLTANEIGSEEFIKGIQKAERYYKNKQRRTKHDKF